jgi:transcriptional regulator with XRE-family HTH domain
MEFKRNELNDLIKEIRLSKKMTQSDFSKFCKLGSFQKVSNIETGSIKVGLNLLQKICNACKYDLIIKIKIKDEE